MAWGKKRSMRKRWAHEMMGPRDNTVPWGKDVAQIENIPQGEGGTKEMGPWDNMVPHG